MEKHNKILALAMLSAVVAGCGGGGDGQATGQVSVRITDAPVDSAASVVVEFSGVELRQDDVGAPQVFNFDTPRQIDLLALNGGETETLLDGVEVPAGRYSQLRLLVNAGRSASDSYITFEDNPDATFPLYIPSGNESGLKLTGGFSVPANGSADFTIDFDLRKSVTDPVGQDGVYILRPTLRMVDTVQVGTIAGAVAAERITADCAPAVYVYSGAGVTPDDVGSAVDPATSATVEQNPAGAYGYTAAFLAPGDYTVAFTCDADADAADVDDEVAFADPTDATVTAGQQTTVDFN